MKKTLRKPARASAKNRKQTFRTFLARNRSSEPLISAFLKEVKQEPPGELDSWKDVRSYLHAIGAAQESYVGARLAWRDFVKARDA